jgi:hypothetical protein
VMTGLEMKRDWKVFGFSHFGTAWLFMAFTCGPHHLVHGYHVLSSGRPPQLVDLLAVVIGLPVGIVWLLLRVEAFRGGQGDRFLAGTPSWLRPAAIGFVVWGVIALLAGAFIASSGDGIEAAAHDVHTSGGSTVSMVTVNLALLVVYMAIGKVVLQTQFANRPASGGWSVSGLSLSVIFPTCGLMHALWSAYGLAGRYHADGVGNLIDIASIPAALYFLAVVMALHREALHDWNDGPKTVHADTGSLLGQ